MLFNFVSAMFSLAYSVNFLYLTAICQSAVFRTNQLFGPPDASVEGRTGSSSLLVPGILVGPPVTVFRSI